MAENNENNKIEKAEQNVSLDFVPSDKMTLQQMMAVADQIVKSPLTPHKRASDIVVAAMYGRELGMGFMAAVNNISNVDGSAFEGINLHASKLLSNGVWYEVTEDFTPIYGHYMFESKSGMLEEEYTKLIETGKGVRVHEKTPAALIKQYKEEKKVLLTRSTIDHRTTIIFYRKIKEVDGNVVQMKYEYSETLSSVIQEVGTKKDGTVKANFTIKPRRMLFANVLRTGARRIGADLVLPQAYGLDELDIETGKAQKAEPTISDVGKVDITIPASSDNIEEAVTED